MFPWGDEPDVDCDHALYNPYREAFLDVRPFACEECVEDGCSGTEPVGGRPAGASYAGTLDVSGSVLEWVEDCWHEDYTGAPADGGAWTQGCLDARRVARGGAFQSTAGGMRTAWRYAYAPASANANVGARCVRPR